MYLHDGHPCQGVDGYCYNGICQTHEQQCITLWGPGTWPPPPGCRGPGPGSPLSVSTSIPPGARFPKSFLLFSWSDWLSGGTGALPGTGHAEVGAAQSLPRGALSPVQTEMCEHLLCARGVTGINQPGPLPSDSLTGSCADRRQNFPPLP